MGYRLHFILGLVPILCFVCTMYPKMVCSNPLFHAVVVVIGSQKSVCPAAQNHSQQEKGGGEKTQILTYTLPLAYLPSAHVSVGQRAIIMPVGIFFTRT